MIRNDFHYYGTWAMPQWGMAVIIGVIAALAVILGRIFRGK